jgi:geranylgeranyl diphosphate synthase, type I
MSDPTDAADSIVVRIQQQMRAAFPQADARLAHYYQMMEYHLGWRDEQLAQAQANPGKLLRPQLCMLACRAAGGDPEQALPAAAALQLIHDFSLIHDDIEDNSDTRRGRRTVWAIWGLAHGINVGDGMFALAHLAMQQLADAGVPAPQVLAALRAFDRTILTICEGQYLDLQAEGDLGVSEEAYLAMIGRKTAALIGACCEIGALVAGAEPATAGALRAFGLNLGLAFQAQDDLLGIWGDPALTGKPYAADLERRKLSLPVIVGLAHPEAGPALRAAYRAPDVDPDTIPQLLGLLEAAGARAYTDRTAARYHQQALAALDQLQGQCDVEAIARLRRIAEGLLGRRS